MINFDYYYFRNPMKICILILHFCIFFFASCDRIIDSGDTENIERLLKKNALKISIDTGVSGTLLMKTGNCMPGVGPVLSKSSCKTFPVDRTVLIFEYSKYEDVTGYGPMFDKVRTQLIDSVITDNEGFFQLSVAPGKYSVFIREKGKYYANSFDGQSAINPVEVKNDSVSIIRPEIDYATY
jgi:hypothetical protein